MKDPIGSLCSKLRLTLSAKYDIDSSSSNLADHDFIGSAESTLAEIVGGPSCRRTFSLRGKNGGPSCGELTVLAEEAENDSKEAAVFALRAVSLDKKKFFGKSDPFLQIYRVNDDGSSQLVHRTEVISKTLNPEWKPFEVSMQQLCGPNRNRTHPIHSLYKHISGFIINHTPPAQLKRIRGNRNFIGSCEIAFDKLVGKNDLEFPNIGSSSFTVFGVAGLLEAYQRCLMSCILYGPTNFASVISEVSKKAASYPRDGSRYHILLIITDGCICDFDQTLSAIIAASYLPLSIIIVGVGGENFDNMNKLDSDDGLLTYQGRRAQRDIVQFVPLRQFLVGKGIASPSFEGTLAGAQLAKEVLAEIPDQLTQYMKLNNIEPRPSTNPFSQPSPPSQATLPTAAVGAMGMQDIRGWAVSQPSQPIGFVGGISQPGGGSAPYPTSTPAPYSSQGASGYGFSTTSSPQYPPPAQIPAPSAIGIYPGGGIPLSAPSSGVQASSIPAGIGFTVVSSNSRFGQPEPPPPYCAFDEGDAAFGLTRTGVTVGERSRTQPSAPPPP
ncbi:Nicotinic receptor-associated protein 1 [Toxocara canis]|uniref:Nicotinic receptor-associated protein 1 n=1 Tax=Toxocara canis TaxID=6265 RepID=A0A0B2VMK1_TOXCA|nr:Nicotinic receptor-associated protein 1 [Toxocara canis]